jgi:uncharacterized protein YqgC (DUF456 family)
MVIRITGTQTVTKVITGPSYSKLYMVDHAGDTSAVTFKAAGQTGVTVVVGEKCFVYYNGTDYVKIATSTAGTGSVTSVAVSGGTTGLTTSGGPITTSGTVTLAGTVATTNGGTGLTSFTSGGVVYASSTSALATGSGLKFDGTNFGVGVTPSATVTKSIQVGPSAGFTGDGVTYGWTAAMSQNAYMFGNNTWKYIGSITAALYLQDGNVHRWYNAPSGTSGDTISFTQVMDISAAGIVSDQNGKLRAVPQSGSAKTASYTLATTDLGEFIQLGASGAIVIPDATFAAGDVVSIFNNTASTATITCSITTAYIAGTFTDKATMTLAAAGVATVLFITSTLCVVTGNVT